MRSLNNWLLLFNQKMLFKLLLDFFCIVWQSIVFFSVHNLSKLAFGRAYLRFGLHPLSFQLLLYSNPRLSRHVTKRVNRPIFHKVGALLILFETLNNIWEQTLMPLGRRLRKARLLTCGEFPFSQFFHEDFQLLTWHYRLGFYCRRVINLRIYSRGDQG